MKRGLHLRRWIDGLGPRPPSPDFASPARAERFRLGFTLVGDQPDVAAIPELTRPSAASGRAPAGITRRRAVVRDRANLRLACSWPLVNGKARTARLTP